MAVVAVANQKGGVGKTTVALGLAAAATRAGLRVLVIDLDPQANATSGLGVQSPARTIDSALGSDRPGALRQIIVPAGWPNGAWPLPDVAPSTPYLAALEPQLASDPVGAQDRLLNAMQGLSYDLVLVDSPPSLGLLTINALFAADRVLVVTEPAAWSADAVEQMLATVGRVATRKPEGLAVAGVVVNRLGRTRDAAYWHEQLVESYGELAAGPIHQRAAIAEASAQSLPLHALGTRPGAAEAVEEFDRLLERATTGRSA